MLQICEDHFSKTETHESLQPMPTKTEGERIKKEKKKYKYKTFPALGYTHLSVVLFSTRAKHTSVLINLLSHIFNGYPLLM